MSARRVLITGARGQVGRALQQAAAADAECTALDRSGLDVADRTAVMDAVARLRPDVIFNAAAYTAVDQAETEAEQAYRINRDGAGHLAEAAQRHGARLVHVSTDYVFDGAQSMPYRPDDAPNPLGVYGASKLAGEHAVAERTGGAALIVRTAWVYAREGRNFVNTMLQLMRERREVRVVGDQIGTPTHAASLARVLWQFAARPDCAGIYHWSDAGAASWYDVAFEVLTLLRARGEAVEVTLTPITTAEYPTRARRPPYSVLDNSATWRLFGPARHWRTELAEACA